jgi:hypothetical protein
MQTAILRAQECIEVPMAADVLERSAGITWNVMYCERHCSVTETVFYQLLLKYEIWSSCGGIFFFFCYLAPCYVIEVHRLFERTLVSFYHTTQYHTRRKYALSKMILHIECYYMTRKWVPSQNKPFIWFVLKFLNIKQIKIKLFPKSRIIYL